MSGPPDIGGGRIRTPGIDGEPVPVDAEVKVHDARAEAPEEDLDRSLRPPTLDDFVNQQQVTEQLAIFIEAAKRRGEPLDHVLLAGPPGLGKTSLAHIVAAELGVPMVQTAGPALERKADVASFLTALEPGSVFFIDEIHRLGRAVEETLYPAMEDGELPVVLGQGAGALRGRELRHGLASADGALPEHHFCVTDAGDRFARIGARFLGAAALSLEWVDV